MEQNAVNIEPIDRSSEEEKWSAKLTIEPIERSSKEEERNRKLTIESKSIGIAKKRNGAES